MKKIIILLFFLGIAGGLVWRSVSEKDFLYAGTIEAVEVDLSSRLSSVIKSYGVREGERVTRGQILAELTCDDIILEADLTENNFRRAQKLYKTGAISKEKFDKLKYARDNARLRLSWCKIKSPINGRVLYKYMEEGELVAPGGKLITVADLSRMYVYFYVPQPMIYKLKPGMKITAYLPEANMKKFAGKIEKINEEAEFTPRNVQTRKERERLVYGVKVVFENKSEELKPGMTLEASFPEY